MAAAHHSGSSSQIVAAARGWYCEITSLFTWFLLKKQAYDMPACSITACAKDGDVKLGVKLTQRVPPSITSAVWAAGCAFLSLFKAVWAECGTATSLHQPLLRPSSGSLHELRGANHAENNECNDQEVDDCADECTKVNTILGTRDWNGRSETSVPPPETSNKWVNDVIDKGGNSSGNAP